MGLEAKIDWKKSTLTIDGEFKNWKASLTYEVFDSTATMTDADAIAACGPVGSEHPLTASLVVKSSTTARVGLNLLLVTQAFVPAQFVYSNNQDPLKQPPTLEVTPGVRSDAIDRDWFGAPVTNSALDGFGSNISKDFSTLLFSYQRNEPYYDTAKHVRYANRLNQDTLTIRTVGTLFPGQVRFLHYRPLTRYTLKAKYVSCEYLFELNGGVKQDSDGLWDGFKSRVKDQGLRAWYDPGDGSAIQLGELFDANGNRISSAVPFDGTGKPLDTSIKAGKVIGGVPYNKFAPVSNPKFNQKNKIIVEAADDKSAYWLKYTKYGLASFAALQLNAF